MIVLTNFATNYKNKREQMSKPIVGIGTKLSQGTVIAIHTFSVDILSESGVQTLTFTQVEKEVFSNG